MNISENRYLLHLPAKAKRSYAESETDTDDFLLDLDYWLESLYLA